MHPIVTDDPQVKAAASRLDEALGHLSDMLAKVEAAQAEHEAKVVKALDQGEAYAPKLEPIATDAAKRHLYRRVEEATRALTEVLGEAGPRLGPALREQETDVLARARVTAVQDLSALLGELQSLQATAAILASPRAAHRWVTADRPDRAGDASLTDLVQAAMTGGSLLGPMPADPPEPTRHTGVFAEELGGAPT